MIRCLVWLSVLLDMGRTACNVTGDLAVSAIVAKSEGEIDMTKWQGSPDRVAEKA